MATALHLKLSFVCCILIGGSLGAGAESLVETRRQLVDAVVANCTSQLRPVVDFSKPVYVYLNFYTYQLNSLDIVNQALDLSYWFDMEWQNEFVSWDPDEYGGIDRIDFTDDQDYWLPDLAFYNRINGKPVSDGPSTPAFVNASGFTRLWQAARTTFACKLDAYYFPFDRHMCEMTIGPWTHRPEQLDLRAGVTTNDNMQENTIWEIVQLGSEYSFDIYESSNYSTMRYFIEVKRRSAFFTGIVVMPSIAISYLSLANFFIPCASGERIGYGVTIFLAQTVNLMIVSDMMPKGGKKIPIWGEYLIFSIFYMAFSLVAIIVTLSIAFNPVPSKSLKPRTIKFIKFRLMPIFGPHQATDKEKSGPSTAKVVPLSKEDTKDNLVSIEDNYEATDEDVAFACETISRCFGGFAGVVLTVVTAVYVDKVTSA